MADDFEARRLALQAELGEPITVDGLTPRWRIFQRKRGHRHSIDDVLTAWYALQTLPQAKTSLDLGSGIGGVGLLVLAGLTERAHLTAIEAQDISHRFLVENVRANQLEGRVCVLHGDLRELSRAERFELVTGSPPYFDVSAGIVPADSQKAHARFELRGDVRDYARAAAAHLTADGRFVFCFPWAQRQRATEAIRAAGLVLERSREVIPREGLAPLFSLYACRFANVPGETHEEPPFVVRTANGEHTETMHDARARWGWPPEVRRRAD